MMETPVSNGFDGEIATDHWRIELSDVCLQRLTMFVFLLLWYVVIS